MNEKNKDKKMATPTNEELAIFAFACYLVGMFPELWREEEDEKGRL